MEGVFISRPIGPLRNSYAKIAPMGAPRLKSPTACANFLDYPKFTGPTRIVLDTGYFFDQSWLRAAAKLGWKTASVRSVITGNLTRDDIASLFQTIGEFKPDFILTSNYAGMDDADSSRISLTMRSFPCM